MLIKVIPCLFSKNVLADKCETAHGAEMVAAYGLISKGEHDFCQSSGRYLNISVPDV